MNEKNTTWSNHYDKSYFELQSPVGEFGGWANLTKFEKYIAPESAVLDFGCGGGFLLQRINCGEKAGVEINATARASALEKGLTIYEKTESVPEEWADVIISNSALEHTLNPLWELQSLYPKLKPGGRMVFVVPCDVTDRLYIPNNRDNHLFSWSPMNLGNLFVEAGLHVITVHPYRHLWPPHYRRIASVFGRNGFELCCKVYGRLWLSRRRYRFSQVRIVGEKPAQ